MSRTLVGKTLFISGASRGIGLAIAVRAARDGANVALIAKTAEPHPKLEGTVYTAAEEIEKAGGKALPIVGDIRDDQQVADAVAATVEKFGGIDICINNASAINLSGTEAMDMKRYDLMQSINTRGTYMVSKACIPHLKASENAHVLTLSPPISLQPRWLGGHIGYTIAKYGMSLCTLGMAEEFKGDGIAFNALWPKTLVATAAVQNLLGGDAAMAKSRKPEIVADAAYVILTRDSREYTANLALVEDVLARGGRDRPQPVLLRRRRRRAAGRPLRRLKRPDANVVRGWRTLDRTLPAHIAGNVCSMLLTGRRGAPTANHRRQRSVPQMTPTNAAQTQFEAPAPLFHNFAARRSCSPFDALYASDVEPPRPAQVAGIIW